MVNISSLASRSLLHLTYSDLLRVHATSKTYSDMRIQRTFWSLLVFLTLIMGTEAERHVEGPPSILTNNTHNGNSVIKVHSRQAVSGEHGFLA